MRVYASGGWWQPLTRSCPEIGERASLVAVFEPDNIPAGTYLGDKMGIARLACMLLTVFATLVPANAQEYDSVADRLAIAEVLAQYSYRWDSKDSEGFSNLFTEDAIMERSASGELIPGSRLEGRQAILTYAKKAHQGRLADRQTRHHMSNLVFIEFTEDTARTENMVLVTHQIEADTAPYINNSGIYRNIWRKTDQGWKIARRVLFIDRAISQ